MALALGVASSSPAYAQANKADQAKAAELKKRGDDLVHQSKFKEALEAYDQSFALVPNPAIYYNRARALESMEDYPAALDAFEKFAANAPPDLKARVPNLDKMTADVASHVATLIIKCPVDGAIVTVGGRNVGTTPVQPQRLAPGEVSITVTAPGYVAFNNTMTLSGGESATLDAGLKKAAANDMTTTQEKEPTPFDQQQQPQPKPEPAPSGGNGVRTLAWVTGGVGLVSLGVGMTFFGLALSDKGSADPNCPGKVCNATGQQAINEAWMFSTVSTVLVVVGAAALATSLISFIVAPKSAPKGTQARFFVGPGFGGIGGTF